MIHKELEKFREKHNVLLGVCRADSLDYAEESIFVMGVGYGKENVFELDDKQRGKIAQSMCGKDYHLSVAEKLDELDCLLKQFAEKEGLDYSSRKQVDAGKLSERLLAVKAGIAFAGRNGNAISEKFGSLFNIGLLVTTLKIQGEENKVPLKEGNCETCGICVKSCPGKALDEGFEYKKCVSYLTQTNIELTEGEKESIGHWLYGCDVCQMVCPHNKGKHTEKMIEIGLMMPELDMISELTEEQFKKTYGKTAIYRNERDLPKRLKILKRNAEIVKKNIYLQNP